MTNDDLHDDFDHVDSFSDLNGDLDDLQNVDSFDDLNDSSPDLQRVDSFDDLNGNESTAVPQKSQDLGLNSDAQPEATDAAYIAEERDTR